MKQNRQDEDGSHAKPLRVLFFEDCVEDIELSLRTLRSAGFVVSWDSAVTPGQVLERLRAAEYDVILSDYRMPGATGMELYDLLRAEGIGTPFILVSGSLGDELAVECLKRGVADYVLKDRPARLPVAVRRALEEERHNRQRAESVAALKSSEASYRSLIQSAPCGILRLSAADGRLLDVNAALAAMLAYGSTAELLRASAAGGIALPPDILARMTAEVGDAGRVAEVEWRRPDGVPLAVRLAGRLLRDEKGAPVCLEMIAENVTERNLAQRRIGQLNRLYSVLIHANQAIVRGTDSRALFREICRIVVEEGGFELAWLGLVDPLIAMVVPQAICPLQDAFPEDLPVTAEPDTAERHPLLRAIRERRHIVCNDLSAGKPGEVWRERALCRNFRSLAAFPILSKGEAIGVLAIYAAEANWFDIENVALLSGLAADVSFALESIATERLHQQVASQLDQFFALSLDMLCITGLDGFMQRLNPSWVKALGFSEEELCRVPLLEFVHPEDRHYVLEAQSRLRRGFEVRDLEVRFLAKDGSSRWLVVSATPALERSEIFAAVTDITARKKLEEQLRSQNLKLEERSRKIEEASRMKNEFLANMSHELRSPLNGILGFTELLYDGKLGKLPARPTEFLGRIHASASHLLQLINGVLDLSKIESGHLEFKPERILISPIVQEVTGILGSLAAEKRIRVETEVDPAADEVTIDASRLRQVLYNYLSNALKFTGEGGVVTVRVKPESASEFRLEVSDTGIGVAEKDLSRLFIEFQQLDASTAKRYQGTGLGLALTKRVVEGQRGRVGVSSVQGKGSTFFAVLPRCPAVANPFRAPAARILVVDDQKLDRLLLTRILESNGYLVEVCTTSAEAYDKCRWHRFDAITLDLVLPDAAGWETLERIRSLENHRHTPVIVISACEPADLNVPLEVQGFLTKPVNNADLLAVLQRAGAMASKPEGVNA